MGQLVDGKWTDEDIRNTDKAGAFQRVESGFRDFVTAALRASRPSRGAIICMSRITARGRTAP